jgi:hypothetical protein
VEFEYSDTLEVLMHSFKAFLACFVAVWAIGVGVHAQQPAAGEGQGRGTQTPPPPPQNLQVLPKDITRPELQRLMQSFNFGLGVTCSYCHVMEPTRDLASDAKATKTTARLMMQMTSHINETIGEGVGKAPADVSVQCATCHRGKAIPETPVAPPPQPPAAGQAPRR